MSRYSVELNLNLPTLTPLEKELGVCLLRMRVLSHFLLSGNSGSQQASKGLMLHMTEQVHSDTARDEDKTQSKDCLGPPEGSFISLGCPP